MTDYQLDPNIRLRVMIVDAERAATDRLSAALTAIAESQPDLALEQIAVHSIPDAYSTLENYKPNAIFIDIFSAKLRDSITFIQHVRQRHPAIVFVLHSSERQMDARRETVYSGWGSRLAHYFLLSKEIGNSELQEAVLFNLMRVQMDLYAYGAQGSLSRARTTEQERVLDEVQVSKLRTQLLYLSRELESLSREEAPGPDSTSRPRAFVIMALSEDLRDVYQMGIKEHLGSSAGVDVFRIDEHYPGGLVIQEIYREIHSARVVIAELTHPRPNCYYELGFADALGKPVIRLAKKGTSLPFDVNQHPFLFYETIAELRPRLLQALRDRGVIET